jgi:hypothetical protein
MPDEAPIGKARIRLAWAHLNFLLFLRRFRERLLSSLKPILVLVIGMTLKLLMVN